MRNNSIVAALALLAAFSPVSAQQHPAPVVHQRATPAKPSAPSRPTDAQIEAAIRVKLAKSKIAADKFHFKVQGGVATIEGKTDVIQRKGAATRMAKTAGAVTVNNHIEISEAAKERAAANLATGRRRAQIKRGDPRDNRAAPHGPATAVAGKTAAPIVQKH